MNSQWPSMMQQQQNQFQGPQQQQQHHIPLPRPPSFDRWSSVSQNGPNGLNGQFEGGSNSLMMGGGGANDENTQNGGPPPPPMFPNQQAFIPHMPPMMPFPMGIMPMGHNGEAPEASGFSAGGEAAPSSSSSASSSSSSSSSNPSQEVVGEIYGRKFGRMLQDIIANRIHGFQHLQQMVSGFWREFEWGFCGRHKNREKNFDEV